MKNSNSNSLSEDLKSGFAAIIIPIEIAIAILIYMFVLGNPDNFQGGDPANHPLPGNYLGIIHQGGPIVPILISLLMLVITFGIERFLTIRGAKGKGSVKKFVRNIRALISSNNIDEAITECDKQRGSVANVVKAGLSKYDDSGS